MKIQLSKVLPNPFRNLSLYPLDQTQIDKLKTSVDRHGFLGGVRARKSPTRKDYVELAYGHTRMEALRQSKRKDVDLDIVAMSDDEMIRLMVTENATQSGSKAAAVMNEVDAVVRRIAKPMLMTETLAQIGAWVPEIAQCFQSENAYETARRHLLKGEGIGWLLIQRYVGGGDEALCPRTKHEIGDAITSVKASGSYAKIIADISGEIEREQAEADRLAEAAERDAERAAKQAKTKKQKSAATKAKNAASGKRKSATKADAASKSAKQAAETSSAKYARTFDEKCATVFPLDEHLRVFREMVTSDSGKKYISVDQQLPLAHAILKEASDTVNKTNRGMMGAPFIKAYISNIIMQAVQAQKGINEQERERLMQEEQDRVVLAKIDGLLWNVRSVIKSAGELFSIVNQHPRWATDVRMTVLIPKIDDSVRMLNSLRGELLDGPQVTPNGSDKTASKAIGHDAAEA